MPTYGYQCRDCQHEFSVFQSMKDQPVSTCPECRGAVKRLLYPVGIVFKGSGWYINDSRAPEKAEGSTPKEGEGKGDGASAAPAKTEASAAESKTAESTSAAKKETAAAGTASS